MRKIDAFAHILPPRYAGRLEAITSGAGVSDRILGYRPWIHEDPALTDLDARWRSVDPFPTVIADTIADIEALGLAEADTAAIFAGNARRVLRIPA